MSKPENPQAFPHLAPHNPAFSYVASGMTLRDWFAGQALAGIMANTEITDCGVFSDLVGGDERIPSEQSAKAAYHLADAMLAHRQKETGDA